METLGRYRLTRKIATGGMAEIWLAAASGPEGFQKRLVVKKILAHLADDEEFVRMFLDEARIAARLNHPNIAQIFDLGEADGSYYIAMEYVPGKDLRRAYQDSVKAKNTIPAPLIARVLIESAKALDYAHRATDDHGVPLQIVHRDVSPQNILVTFQGGVKLVDFGIAKAADQVTQTRAGVLKGKYSYMSPEQAAGDPVDARTDIFALGIVGYELVTGFRLFKRDSEVATLQAVRDCRVPPPSSVLREVPRALDKILLKALAKRPDDRHGTAGQLALELEDFLLQGRHPASSTHLAEFMQALYPDQDEDSAVRAAPPRDSQSGSSARQLPVHTREKAAAGPPAREKAPSGRSPSPAAAAARARPTGPTTTAQRPASPRKSTPPPVPAKPWQTADDVATEGPDALTLEPETAALQPAPAPTEAPTRVGASRTEAPTRVQQAQPEESEEATAAEEAPDGASRPRRFRLPPAFGAGAWRFLARAAVAGGAAALAVAALPALRAWLGRATDEVRSVADAGAPAGQRQGKPLSTRAVDALLELRGSGGPPGKLTLVTEPPATVYLGDEVLGTTPLVEVPVAPGHLVLRVVNESFALDQPLPIDVKTSGVTPVRRDFSQGVAPLTVPKGHSYQVLFHDKPLGRVPGPPIQMVEGSHVLTLVDEQSGERREATVEVRAAPKRRR